MKPKKIAFYLVFLVIVASYFFFYEIKYKTRKEEAKKAKKKVFKVAFPELQRLKLNSEKGEVCLEKKKDSWEIISPFKELADLEKVEDFFKTLEDAKSEEIIEEASENLKKYGLKKPKIEVELIDKKGNSFNLKIGDKTPAGDFLYALLPDKKVATLDSILHYDLNKSVDDFRDKSVFKKPFEPTQITLIDGEKKIFLEKKEERWEMSFPYKVKVKEEKVSDLIEKVKGEEIKEFLKNSSKDLSLYKLSPPEKKIIFSKNGKKFSILLGKKDEEKNEIYAKREDEPWVFSLWGDFLDKISFKAFDYQEKKFLTFNPEKLKKIEIEYPHQKIVLEKIKGRWETKPKKMVIEKEKVDSLISKIEELEYVKILGKKKIEPKNLKVKITLDEGEKTERLLIGKKISQKLLISQVEKNPLLYAIDRDFLLSLPQNIEELKIDE